MRQVLLPLVEAVFRIVFEYDCVGEELVPLQQLTANVLGAMGAFPSLPRAAPRVRTGG